MKQDDLVRAVGDLARRVAAAEGRTASTVSLAAGSSSSGRTQSFMKSAQAQRTGWTTADAWEPLVYQPSPSLQRGASLSSGTTGIRTSASGIYRITAVVKVLSTSPGSDALLGILVNGTALSETVKLDPEDLVHGATGTYYDSACLTTLASLGSGVLVAAALRIQGNPGLTTPADEGFLLLEKIA